MEKDLKDLGIYDLRNYARAMGVQSPTTLKRDELIARINQIVEGEIPQKSQNKKGRPPKHSATDNYVLDMILPNNIFGAENGRASLTKKSNTENPFKNMFSEESGDFLNNNIVFKGFFDNFNEEYGIVHFRGYMTEYAKENTIVLRPLVEKYGLKSGDYIEGNSRYIPQKNIMLATEINFVNDIDATEIKRTSFEDIIPTYPTKKIVLSDKKPLKEIEDFCPIAKGSRTVVDVQNKKIETVKSILNALTQKNNIRTLLVSIDDSPEDIGTIVIDCKDVEVCQLKSYQNRQDYFKQFEMYVKNCVNRLECGDNIAIVFYNAKGFENFVKQSFILSQNINECSADILAFNKMKDILNLSRTYGTGSLTIICFDADKDLIEFSNCYVKLDFDGNLNDLILNKEKSFTKSKDKIN